MPNAHLSASTSRNELGLTARGGAVPSRDLSPPVRCRARIASAGPFRDPGRGSRSARPSGGVLAARPLLGPERCLDCLREAECVTARGGLDCGNVLGVVSLSLILLAPPSVMTTGSITSSSTGRTEADFTSTQSSVLMFKASRSISQRSSLARGGSYIILTFVQHCLGCEEESCNHGEASARRARMRTRCCRASVRSRCPAVLRDAHHRSVLRQGDERGVVPHERVSKS
jgi:hypothetical protein